MPDQNQHNEAFEYSVWIPVETPSGQKVAIQSGERDGRHMMHAETPDQSEFYLEVLAYEGRLNHSSLAEDQRQFLAEHSGDGTTSEPVIESIFDLSGTTFQFEGTLQGKWKVRKFLFVDGPNRTYRVVHDPRSELNKQAMQSLALRDRTTQFFDPGILKDGELELVLAEVRPAEPANGIVPEYKFEMRHETGASAGHLGFRIYLTDQLASYGGHIGYDVETQFRGAHFAARSCRLIFPLVRRHGIRELLITCAPDNLASRKTIESIGGTLVRIGRATTETGVERDTCYYHVAVPNS